MKPYTIKAHPTTYKDARFRSRLEARWAAFFDLIDWKWEYEPIDLEGWSPDFLVSFPCSHSQCHDHHTLLVEVKPYLSISDFTGHPCMDHAFGVYANGKLIADSGAAFGNSPHCTQFEISHGGGGGIYGITDWINIDIDRFWNKAGAIVQYHADADYTSDASENIVEQVCPESFINAHRARFSVPTLKDKGLEEFDDAIRNSEPYKDEQGYIRLLTDLREMKKGYAELLVNIRKARADYDEVRALALEAQAAQLNYSIFEKQNRFYSLNLTKEFLDRMHLLLQKGNSTLV